MPLYVLGSSEVVAAFAMGGIPGKAVQSLSEIRRALDDIRSSHQIQVLVLEEDVAIEVREELNRWKLDPKAPLIVEVPGFAGPSEDRQTAQRLVQQALGITI